MSQSEGSPLCFPFCQWREKQAHGAVCPAVKLTRSSLRVKFRGEWLRAGNSLLDGSGWVGEATFLHSHCGAFKIPDLHPEKLNVTCSH